MSSENGFIDLRLNQEGTGNSNESFWPSFTDIMTVIVMIFLIAMVVLLIRNMELVQQLRSTMEAERMAAELAKATGEENESISMRLINTESELSDLRLQLMKMQEIRRKQLTTIKDQMAQISQISKQRDELTMNNSQLKTQVNSLENQTLQLTQRSQQLAQKNEQLTNRIETTNEQLSEIQQAMNTLQYQHNMTLQQYSDLQQSYTDKQNELELAQNRIALSDAEKSELQGDFDKLKVKYDKLVRPARTPAGKQVVEVRYSKSNGKYIISVKTPDDDGFTRISKKALETKLGKLKEKFPDKLYIKVIFPENSGLSYSEAWGFTSHLHKNYDYYFQDSFKDRTTEE